MPVLIFLLLLVQPFLFYARHANNSAKFPFKNTNPIINASFVFIVFLWLWCTLPLEFRSQQQIKDIMTLLSIWNNHWILKHTELVFQGCGWESLLYFYGICLLCFISTFFNLLSAPQRPIDIPEKQLDCMPFTDYAKLSVLITLEDTDASASTSHPGEKLQKLQVSIADFKWTHWGIWTVLLAEKPDRADSLIYCTPSSGRQIWARTEKQWV